MPDSAYVENFWVDGKKYSEKNVILLGSFNKLEIELLNNLKLVLGNFGYEGIIVDIKRQIKEIEGITPRQAMHYILAGCNFVIANDTKFGGQIAELEYCRNCGAVTAIIAKRGERCSLMTLDHHIHSPDFKTFCYYYGNKNLSKLEKLVERIIKWAKKRKIKRKKDFCKVQTKFDSQFVS